VGKMKGAGKRKSVEGKKENTGQKKDYTQASKGGVPTLGPKKEKKHQGGGQRGLEKE